MRNNVIYNWAGSGCYGGEGMNVNIVNNYYKPGPATPRGSKVGHRITAIGVRTTGYTHHDSHKPNAWDPMWHRWGRFFIDGNVMEGHPDITADNWTLGVIRQAETGDYDGMYSPELSVRYVFPLLSNSVMSPPTPLGRPTNSSLREPDAPCGATRLTGA